MAVRSRRLWGPRQTLLSTTEALYTVPAGRTLVLRHLIVANHSASVNALFTLLCNGITSTSFGFWKATTLTPNQNLSLPVWWAFNPGDVLYIQTGPGAHVMSIGFGSLLDGVPA